MATLRDLVFLQPRPPVSLQASATALFAAVAPCYKDVVHTTTAECADDGLYSAVPEPPTYENDCHVPCDQLLAIETDLNDRLQQGSRGVYTDVQEEDIQEKPQEQDQEEFQEEDQEESQEEDQEEPQEEPQEEDQKEPEDDEDEEDVDLNVCSSDDEPDREVIDLCLHEAQQTVDVIDLCSDSEDEAQQTVDVIDLCSDNEDEIMVAEGASLVSSDDSEDDNEDEIMVAEGVAPVSSDDSEDDSESPSPMDDPDYDPHEHQSSNGVPL